MPHKNPERFAFTFRFPEFRDAIDIIRMTGGADTANLVFAGSTLSLVRERNGIHCSATLPIEWKSVPWNGNDLLFTTKMALFDRLLRHDVAWDAVTISGDYPGAALDASSPERDCSARLQVAEVDVRWPLTFAGNTAAARPPISEPTTLVDAHAMSHAANLISQVLAADEVRILPDAPASFGNARAFTAGRAGRIVHDQRLSFGPVNIRWRHLKDLAYILNRMGPNTKLIQHEGRISFLSDRVQCSLDAAAAAPPELSVVEAEPLLGSAEILTFSLAADIKKIASQSTAKDDRIWLRTKSDEQLMQMVLPVTGGDALVSIDVANTTEHQLPDSDIVVEQSMLTYLTPVGRAKTTTLGFHPRMLVSRQIHDGATITTFIPNAR